MRRTILPPETEQSTKNAPDTQTKKHKTYTWGLGRRKTAVARVRIAPGQGNIQINRKDLTTYFTEEQDRKAVNAPLVATDATERFDIWANVRGGGTTGQAGAVLLGIARALIKVDPDLEQTLRAGGYLTRDARMVERKKYGQRGARRRFQFSKR